MTRARGPLLGLVALAVGAVSAVASIALHNAGWGWWLWCVGAPVALLVALPGGWLRCGFGVGWVAVILIAMIGRPEGDFVVSANPRGYGLLAASLAILVASIGTLPVRRTSARKPSGGNEESATPPPGT